MQKSDFDLILAEYSVILLFLSKTMKKTTLFASFFNMALYELNVLFTYSACMHLLFLAGCR